MGKDKKQFTFQMDVDAIEVEYDIKEDKPIIYLVGYIIQEGNPPFPCKMREPGIQQYLDNLIKQLEGEGFGDSLFDIHFEAATQIMDKIRDAKARENGE